MAKSENANEKLAKWLSGLDGTKGNADFSEDGLLVIKNGSITRIEPKEHGQDTIIWKNGQVLDIERNERIRIDGQEVI